MGQAGRITCAGGGGGTALFWQPAYSHRDGGDSTLHRQPLCKLLVRLALLKERGHVGHNKVGALGAAQKHKDVADGIRDL